MEYDVEYLLKTMPYPEYLQGREIQHDCIEHNIRVSAGFGVAYRAGMLSVKKELKKARDELHIARQRIRELEAQLTEKQPTPGDDKEEHNERNE